LQLSFSGNQIQAPFLKFLQKSIGHPKLGYRVPSQEAIARCYPPNQSALNG